MSASNIVDAERKEPLKYPVLFMHGFGFRDSKKLSYWGRIPKVFTQRGCSVHFGGQDSSGSIQANAEYLKDKIDEILNQSGAEKINVIAHSKGG
ncbi:MAG: esterase/lipase family protein, partial [Candidatus Coproplasma sp.]